MRYTCVAFDYDGTLASDGRVPEDVLHALSKVKQTGRVERTTKDILARHNI